MHGGDDSGGIQRKSFGLNCRATQLVNQRSWQVVVLGGVRSDKASRIRGQHSDESDEKC